MLPNRTRYEIADLLADQILYIGDGYRAKNEELSSTGLPFARVSNINNGFRFEDADHFPEENLERVGEKISRPNDVVFTSKGTVGRFAFVKPDIPRFVFSPQICFWRVLDLQKIDPRFLYYWMHAREFFLQVSGVKSQTDMADFVSLVDQRRMHITLPPLPEQRAIAHILGTLDDKIELNRKMNETLEGIARALFKSWFVDFDPVREKAEGRQPAGMDAETAALFPDAFEDSELGEIPRGWEVGTFGEIADNPRRGVLPEEVAPEMPYIGLEHMPRKSIALTDWGRASETISNKFHCRQGEILFGKLRPYFHKVGIAPLDGVCSTDILVIRPKSDEWYSSALSYVSSDEFVNHVVTFSDGTKMPRTNWHDMARYEIVIPTRDVVMTFNNRVLPMIQRIRANILQSRTLAALRDTLLRKLMSGEIQVKDAEKVVGAAA
jgi:type I restriction enzyme S subunit